jgi:hypothetical protein
MQLFTVETVAFGRIRYATGLKRPIAPNALHANLNRQDPGNALPAKAERIRKSSDDAMKSISSRVALPTVRSCFHPGPLTMRIFHILRTLQSYQSLRPSTGDEKEFPPCFLRSS